MTQGPIYNAIHSPFGENFGLLSNKWCESQGKNVSCFAKHTFWNLTNIASWIPLVSTIVGLGRIIVTSVQLGRYKETGPDANTRCKAAYVQIGRGVIELIPLGFALVFFADLGFTIARARNPYQ